MQFFTFPPRSWKKARNFENQPLFSFRTRFLFFRFVPQHNSSCLVAPEHNSFHLVAPTIQFLHLVAPTIQFFAFGSSHNAILCISSQKQKRSTEFKRTSVSFPLESAFFSFVCSQKTILYIWLAPTIQFFAFVAPNTIFYIFSQKPKKDRLV